MKENFTPGPWIDDMCGHVYVNVTYDNGTVRKMHVATASNIDARLIAAAPDMYEALKEIARADTIAHSPGKYSLVVESCAESARAALAKADGTE